MITKTIKKHDYLNKILSNVDSQARKSGNIILQFLTKLYIDLFFLLLKAVQLTTFYCKITLISYSAPIFLAMTVSVNNYNFSKNKSEYLSFLSKGRFMSIFLQKQ